MKKILSVFLVLMLLISVLVACDNADEDSTNDNTTNQTETTEAIRQTAQVSYLSAAESFAGGSGTENDPFQISEAGHLVLLHEMLEKEAQVGNFDDTYTKGYYIITADISLNDTSDFGNWSKNAPEYGWKSIGNNFAGVLDGNGHKITGMFIDADGVQTETYKDYYGLFAELSGAVKNLTVENSYIRASGSTANVGTIAGYAANAVIENCNADTVIELYQADSVGGIAGIGGNITACTFTGDITQLDDSFVHIGGIAGSSGNISDCSFAGTLSGKGYTGGIVGYGTNVKNCVNKGNISGDTAGGIIGRVYAVGTNPEIEDPQFIIENCINEGTVTATVLAGGIVGWIGNDESDISVSVINCENKGQLKGDESVAGIIGKLSVERSGIMKIENCTNNVDISGKGKTGGIIAEISGAILHQEGTVLISSCKNLADITSESLYSAGIVTCLLIMGNEVALKLNIDGCVNEGAIQSASCAGGILGFSNIGYNSEISAEVMKFSEDTKVTLNECKNSGSITVNTSNAMVGGIVGVLGLGYISADITNCENFGAVSIDFTLTQAQIDESQGAAWTEIFQIGGGIIGRIGDALKLTTAEYTEINADNVNSENANINISGCRNSGTVKAPDYSFILNKWGQPLYVNYLGGLVGQCSLTDGYAFTVENCSFSGTERGLGNTGYADIGTKN